MADQPRIWLLTGRRGCGKTTRVQSLIADLLEDGCELALIHDPHRQFPGRRWRSVEDYRAADVVDTVNCFTWADPSDLAALALEIGRTGTRVALVIDELQRYSTAHGYVDDPPRKRGEPWTPGSLNLVVREGRHVNVDLVGCMHSPTNVNKDTRNLAVWFFFATASGSDSRWIAAATAGRPPTAIGSVSPDGAYDEEPPAAHGCAESDCAGGDIPFHIARLGKFRYVRWDPDDTSDLS